MSVRKQFRAQSSAGTKDVFSADCNPLGAAAPDLLEYAVHAPGCYNRTRKCAPLACFGPCVHFVGGGLQPRCSVIVMLNTA